MLLMSLVYRVDNDSTNTYAQVQYPTDTYVRILQRHYPGSHGASRLDPFLRQWMQLWLSCHGINGWTGNNVDGLSHCWLASSETIDFSCCLRLPIGWDVPNTQHSIRVGVCRLPGSQGTRMSCPQGQTGLRTKRQLPAICQHLRFIQDLVQTPRGQQPRDS